MAPRKPAATADTSEKKPVNETNKVVKRPARGYHKFKNGFLNVKPKGGEIEITKSNQESPLLRLPPEIRNKIWGYTLGHNIFRSILIRLGKRKFKYEWMSRPDEPHIGLPLLATCRQIYSEAAIMPFNLNTFVADTLNGERNMLRAFKVFNAHQRKQITSIRLVYKSYDLLGSDALNDFNVYQLEGYRAQLKRLHSKLNTMEFVILSGEVEYLSEEGVAHI